MAELVSKLRCAAHSAHGMRKTIQTPGGISCRAADGVSREFGESSAVALNRHWRKALCQNKAGHKLTESFSRRTGVEKLPLAVSRGVCAVVVEEDVLAWDECKRPSSSLETLFLQQALSVDARHVAQDSFRLIPDDVSTSGVANHEPDSTWLTEGNKSSGCNQQGGDESISPRLEQRQPVQRVNAPPQLNLAPELSASPSRLLAQSTGGETVSDSVFSAVLQSETPPATQQEKTLGDDYHVNVGYAIRTLREELPTLFYKEMSYDIYRDDITFQDPLNTFRGINSYQRIFWALRFHGRIFFKALWVDVNRVWQPNDRTITVRWSVRGVPRVPWEAWGRFDGTSEYKLDKNGKIYSHKVDNVVLSDPPRYRPLTVIELLQLSPARQTPGITCFSSQDAHASEMWPKSGVPCLAVPKEGGSSEVWACKSQPAEGSQAASASAGLVTAVLGGLGLGSISWFRFYLAMTGTLALHDDLDFAARALLLA